MERRRDVAVAGRAVLAVFLAVLVPGLALANMAAPTMPGDRVGEPRGALAGVAIEREELVFDLRPVAERQRATVEATYFLRNGGGAVSSPIVFVGGDGIGANEVWLNGAPVAREEATFAPSTLPASWVPPGAAPGTTVYATTFRLDLPPGQSTVRVRYTPKPTLNATFHPIHNELGYSLAPARDWASFGRLEVRVEVPPGWEAESEPALARQGDTLTGAFDGVPADGMRLWTQAPYVMVRPWADLPYTLLASVVAVVIAALVGRMVGTTLGRRRRSAHWAWLVTVPLAVLLGILVSAGFVLELNKDAVVYAPVVDGQASWTHNGSKGYAAMLLVALFPLACVVTLPVAQICAARAAGAARRRLGSAPAAAAPSPAVPADLRPEHGN